MTGSTFGSVVIDAFKTLDLYGTGAQIGIKGNSKSNSIFGALITLAALAASIYLTSDSFSNMVNGTEPTITRDVGFENSILYLNSKNFDFNLAFFKPYNVSKNMQISDVYNNYSYVTRFYDLNYTCWSCIGIQKKQFQIRNFTGIDKNKCNPDCIAPQSIIVMSVNDTFNRTPYQTSQFEIEESIKNFLVYNNQTKLKNISISSLSKNYAKNIINLFSNYSFTFPNNFSAILSDEDSLNSSSSVDFAVNIPINSNPIPQSQILQQMQIQQNSMLNTNQATQPQGGTSTQPQGGTSTQPQGGTSTQPQGGTSTQPQGGTSTQPQGGTSTQPQGGTSTQPQGGTSTQPQGGTSTQPQGGTSTQPQGGTSTQPQGGTSTQPQGGTTTPSSGGTSTPSTSGTSTQPQGGTTTQPQGGTSTQPQGGTTTQPQGGTSTPSSGGTSTPSSGGTSTPSSGGTSTPSTSGTSTPSTSGTSTQPQGGTSTPSTSGTSTPSTSGTSTPSSGGTSTPSSGGTSTPSGGNKGRRILQQTQIDSLVFSDMLTKMLPPKLKDLSNSNNYPKLLLLYSDKYVTGNQIKDIYYLESIQYMDQLTENPISYNVYIQQTNITVDKSILWTDKSVITYYSIQSIRRNDLDTTSRSEAALNFKVYPVINLITVKYVTLSDVLSNFGSYYSVFTLIATIVCSLFSPIVYEGDLVNAVFKFKEGVQSFKKIKGEANPLKKRIQTTNYFNPEDGKKNDSKVSSNNYIERKKDIFEDFDLKINEEEKPKFDGKTNGVVSNNDHQIPIVQKKPEENIPKVQNLRKSLSNDLNINKEEFRFKRGRKVEIGSLILFIILNFGCCYDKKKVELMKRCIKVIEKHAQIEEIIKCQMEVGLLKKILLTEKQRKDMAHLFKGLQIDNLELSQGILDEIEGKNNEIHQTTEDFKP